MTILHNRLVITVDMVVAAQKSSRTRPGDVDRRACPMMSIKGQGTKEWVECLNQTSTDSSDATELIWGTRQDFPFPSRS